MIRQSDILLQAMYSTLISVLKLLAKYSPQGICVFEWERYEYLSWLHVWPLCLFPNKMTCFQLHGQITPGLKSKLTRVKITLKHHLPGILPHASAAILSAINFSVKANFFLDLCQRKRETYQSEGKRLRLYT